QEACADLGCLGEQAFVPGPAGNDCDIARDHRTPLVAHAEIHLALEHPNDLLVRVLMRAGMRARLDFPPHDHSMLARKNAALDLVIDTLPRQLLERAEPRPRGPDRVLPLRCPGTLWRLSTVAGTAKETFVSCNPRGGVPADRPPPNGYPTTTSQSEWVSGAPTGRRS